MKVLGNKGVPIVDMFWTGIWVGFGDQAREGIYLTVDGEYVNSILKVLSYFFSKMIICIHYAPPEKLGSFYLP